MSRMSSDYTLTLHGNEKSPLKKKFKKSLSTLRLLIFAGKHSGNENLPFVMSRKKTSPAVPPSEISAMQSTLILSDLESL